LFRDHGAPVHYFSNSEFGVESSFRKKVGAEWPTILELSGRRMVLPKKIESWSLTSL
jgi:hypothetical protein